MAVGRESNKSDVVGLGVLDEKMEDKTVEGNAMLAAGEEQICDQDGGGQSRYESGESGRDDMAAECGCIVRVQKMMVVF